jgi:predicted nucleic acid-binding protein
MKISDAFQTLTRVFLDTSPVVYYVEATPDFAAVVDATFSLLDEGRFQAVVSPVTLAECLVLPRRLGQLQVEQAFIDFLTDTEGIEFVALDAAVGQLAADLRVRYNLKLPDALQVAAAISAGCNGFLTNDEQLRRVAELQVLVIGKLEV